MIRPPAAGQAPARRNSRLREGVAHLQALPGANPGQQIGARFAVHNPVAHTANSSAAFRPSSKPDKRCAVSAPNRRPTKRHSSARSSARPRSTPCARPSATPCATNSFRQSLILASSNVAVSPPRLSAKARSNSARRRQAQAAVAPQPVLHTGVEALPEAGLVTAAILLKRRRQ